ncbi:hypothetical protein [Nocardiopsis sp. NRRL B-16309]|uniref:hypothetical protein n=1 Tax=Nocardiopsis sp. NRRL B-16309 TaxID=1519494 RepID=UPI0006AF59C7|nr:hypothetical protein [Nocardiopsis sp. NRRL B-16309]KOX14025.1 hypothetical protein ADL05_17445 [Nocardiopsis sp. NRRL B-16309]
MPRDRVARTPSPRSLNLRRLLGACIAVAMVWGLFWLLFRSGLTDPLLEMAAPGYERLVAMINDPLGIDWGGRLVTIAAILIPHLGILLFVFDENA